MIRTCGSDRLLKYADGASSRSLRVLLLLQNGEQTLMFSCATHDLRLTLAVGLDIAISHVKQSHAFFVLF